MNYSILDNLYPRCGLNADWCVEAWHLGQAPPNTTSGDLYIVEDEDEDDAFYIVRREYVDDENDTIDELHGPMTQAMIVDKSLTVVGVKT